MYLLGDSVHSVLPDRDYLVSDRDWPSFSRLFPPIALENSTRRFKDVGTTLHKRPGAE